MHAFDINLRSLKNAATITPWPLLYPPLGVAHEFLQTLRPIACQPPETVARGRIRRSAKPPNTPTGQGLLADASTHQRIQNPCRAVRVQKGTKAVIVVLANGPSGLGDRSRSGLGRAQSVRADTFDYIEVFYNPKRRHSTLGYVSPVKF